MRKVTISLDLRPDFKELINPFMEYLEYYQMEEVLRLDFEKGEKIILISFLVKEGHEIDDVPIPEYLELLNILKKDGRKYTCLIKVNVPETYKDMMTNYNLDLIWDTPFLMDGEKVVVSVIGGEDDIQNFIELIKNIGDIIDIRFPKAEFQNTNLLSCLTEKQREVLLEAKKSGYYNYPREVTTEDLSQKLGISKSTTVEHLRKAEKRLMADILAGF